MSFSLLEYLFPILLRYFRLTDGRDKFLKVVQYFFKFTYHSQPEKRITALITVLSSARKCIRLGHTLEPLAELHTLLTTPTKFTSSYLISILNAVLSAINDVIDDVCALAKFGVLSPSLRRFESLATKLWAITIAIDLSNAFLAHSQSVRSLEKRRLLNESAVWKGGDVKLQQEVELEKKIWMGKVSILKLMSDAGFCWIDWKDEKGREKMQNGLGLASGVAAVTKLVWKAL